MFNSNSCCMNEPFPISSPRSCCFVALFTCLLCISFTLLSLTENHTHVNITNIQVKQEEEWSWRSRFLFFFIPCDRKRRQVGCHHSSQIFYVPMMHHVSVALSELSTELPWGGKKMALNSGNRGRALQFTTWHKFIWPPADLLAAPGSFLAPPCTLREKQHLTQLKLTLTQKWVVGVESRRCQ